LHSLICGVVYAYSWLHLLFNLLVQVLVGLPLEMVHGSLRIGVVYMAGVLAGEVLMNARSLPGLNAVVNGLASLGRSWQAVLL